MLMGALLACMSGHNLNSWCPQRPKEGIRSPGNVVRDAFELLCGCREKNPYGNVVPAYVYLSSKYNP